MGSPRDQEWVAPAFGLEQTDLHSELPLEVISTGLRYLIVPVIPGALERARIARDIGSQLKTVNAQFAVLLDESAIEVRHWNNDGVVEDIATGSAAGTIGAYRLRHGLAHPGEMLSSIKGGSPVGPARCACDRMARLARSIMSVWAEM